MFCRSIKYLAERECFKFSWKKSGRNTVNVWFMVFTKLVQLPAGLVHSDFTFISTLQTRYYARHHSTSRHLCRLDYCRYSSFQEKYKELFASADQLGCSTLVGKWISIVALRKGLKASASVYILFFIIRLLLIKKEPVTFVLQ